MSVRWGCRGDARRAASQVESICWKCRVRLQQRALYHISPPRLRNSDPQCHDPRHHRHDSGGGEDAHHVQKAGSKTQFLSVISVRGKLVPTEVIQDIDNDSYGVNRAHDTRLTPNKLQIRKPLFDGFTKCGLKPPNAGSKEISEVAKDNGNQKLHIEKKVKYIKLRLTRSDIMPQLINVARKATRNQKGRIRKFKVYENNTLGDRSFERNDPQIHPQIRCPISVESIITVAPNLGWRSEPLVASIMTEDTSCPNLRKPYLRQRKSPILEDLWLKCLLSRGNGNLSCKRSYHSSTRNSSGALGTQRCRYASTTANPISSPEQAPRFREKEPHWRPRHSNVRSVRDELQAWQEKQGPIIPTKPFSIENSRNEPGGLQNPITRSHGASTVDESNLTEGDVTNTRVSNGIFQYDDRHIEKTADMFLEPGDMIELSVGGSVMLAIYIRTLTRQAQFYTEQGTWCHRLPSNVWWADRHFADVSEVEPIRPYLPTTEIPIEELDELHSMGQEVPRDVGAKLIDKMTKFTRAANEVYRVHAERIDRVFDIMADEKHLRYATLTEMASEVLQISDISKISKPELFTIHRACMDDEIGFVVETGSHWANGKYEILSKREVRIVRQVREWLREHQALLAKRVEPYDRQSIGDSSQEIQVPDSNGGAQVIANFVKKARQIVMGSRQFRPQTQFGSIGPSRVQLLPQRSVFAGESHETSVKNVALGSFTESESNILRFLEIWTARRCLRLTSPVSAMGPMLLRAIGMYEGFELGQRTGFTFLQEMGVFAPWENRVSFNTRLALPGYHFDTLTDELQDNVHESLKSWAPIDSMMELRKDWGDLEVFCIDSAIAQEIDDGFSLEKIEGDDSQFWIHIHIANPSAFIAPGHPLSKYAAQITETLYLPEKTYHMLSPRIAQKYFSLGKDRPALTFSAKINRNGDILDSKITPSRVHNVKYFTAELIASELALKDIELLPTDRLVVGSNPPPSTNSKRQSSKRMSVALDETQRQTLATLKELGTACRRRRSENGAVNISFQFQDLSVYYLEPTQPYRRVIRRIEGDPTIVLATEQFDPAPKARTEELGAGNILVSNMMILTCEIAALWTRSRGIPVLYRGTQKNPDLPSPADYKRLILDPLIGPDGIPPFLTMMEYMKLVGAGYSSVDPIRHQMIGTDAYVKVTSPLRRYGDMIAHWQIEAALRHEAKTGRSLVGTTDHSYLPFSRDQITTLVPIISKRESHIVHAKRNAQLHWVMIALFRAFYFQEARLPETFKVYLWGLDGFRLDLWRGVTKELRLDVNVKGNHASKAAGGLERGDWWEAKIEKVDIYMKEVTMEPVRLIERAEPDALTDSIAGLGMNTGLSI